MMYICNSHIITYIDTAIQFIPIHEETGITGTIEGVQRVPRLPEEREGPTQDVTIEDGSLGEGYEYDGPPGRVIYNHISASPSRTQSLPCTH
jgi:hypothetical protein